MAYATLTDLIEKFGESDLVDLTDIDDPRVNGVVQSRIDEQLARASAEIDSYVAPRYSVPLSSPVPPTIKGVCCDMAFFYLHRLGANQSVVDAYDRAVRFLRDLAAGKAGLALPDGGTPAVSPSADLVQFVAPPRIGGWGLR